MTAANTPATNTVTTQPAAPAAVVDLLNSLLESAVYSIFRFMGEGSPYLSRATAEIRRPLHEMVLANQRRAAELAGALESLGVVATPQAAIQRDEQYLAFLSLKFLLPKLVTEKKLCIERCENALGGIARFPQVPPQIPTMLRAHLAELKSELATLEHAAAHVNAKNGDPSKRAGGTKSNSDAGPSAG